MTSSETARETYSTVSTKPTPQRQQRRPSSEYSWALPPFLLLFAIALIITIYRFEQILNSGSFGWDSASFLENGAVYAGFPQYQHTFDQTRPPFIPLILSLMFGITGRPSATDGYVLSAFLYFLAILSCYLLAEKIMNPWLAIMPALSYGIAPMVVRWGGIVYSNVEGVAVASLGLLLFVYATERKERRTLLFLVAIPLLILAPLTRYTMGIIFLPALVYLLASRNTLRVLRERDFWLGIFTAFLVVALISTEWLVLPLKRGFSLASLFPGAQQLNPFISPLGHLYFTFSLPNDLGTGWYGYLLVVAFVISSLYALISLRPTPSRKSMVTGSRTVVMRNFGNYNAFGKIVGPYSTLGHLRRRANEADPLIFSLLAWFVVLFLNYSFLWSYYDPRYSVEYIMPATILAFWGIGRVLNHLFASGLNAKKADQLLALAIVTFLGVLIVSSVASLEIQAGIGTLQTPVVDTSLSAGMKQAVAWMDHHVPPGTRIEADWPTFLDWYAPNYVTIPAPAYYQLQSPADYQNWMNSLSQNNVSYVVYSTPSLIKVPAQLQPVFNSTGGAVAVFRVLS